MGNCLLDIDKIQLVADNDLAREIKNSLKSEPDILDFSLNTEQDRYFVNVKVKHFDQHKVRMIFESLVSFIQYSGFTYYQRQINPDSIIYQLISGDENKVGFYCHITFTV